MYLSLVALGLRCCAWAFSSFREWGLLSGCGAWAAHFCDFSCGAQTLGTWASVGAAHRL